MPACLSLSKALLFPLASERRREGFDKLSQAGNDCRVLLVKTGSLFPFRAPLV
jgi:hypothetical protein